MKRENTMVHLVQRRVLVSLRISSNPEFVTVVGFCHPFPRGSICKLSPKKDLRCESQVRLFSFFLGFSSFDKSELKLF